MESELPQTEKVPTHIDLFKVERSEMLVDTTTFIKAADQEV